MMRPSTPPDDHGPPPKFHGTRDILATLPAQHIAGRSPSRSRFPLRARNSSGLVRSGSSVGAIQGIRCRAGDSSPTHVEVLGDARAGVPQLVGDLPGRQARAVEFGCSRLPEDVASDPGELLGPADVAQVPQVLDGSRQPPRESGNTGPRPRRTCGGGRQGEGRQPQRPRARGALRALRSSPTPASRTRCARSGPFRR